MSPVATWITGFGVLSALGRGEASLRAALGREPGGVRPDAALDGRPAGCCPEPLDERATRRLDRTARLFVAAAEDAWRQAGLAGGAPPDTRVAVLEGSSAGAVPGLIECLGDPHHRHRGPSALVRFMTGAGSAFFAQAHGLDGPVHSLAAGSISSACALGEAWEMLRAGRVDLVVAGGAEAPLTAEILRVFAEAGLLAPGMAEDAPGCRPFDTARAGTVLGEGAAVFVLETETHARARHAVPRATLLGYGVAGERGSMTAPDPTGAGVAAAITRARSTAPEAPAWIKAHGTGTRLGDLAEMNGLAVAFGAALRELPVTSLKPRLGHALGASGALEAAVALAALDARVVPPTLNTRDIDPALPPCRVATEPLQAGRGPALLVSEGFGGRAAALLLGRP